MSLFDRIKNVLKANINSALDQLEDEKKLKEQVLLDLAEAKKKASALLISALAHLKTAEKKAQELAHKLAHLGEDIESLTRQNLEAEKLALEDVLDP